MKFTVGDRVLLKRTGEEGFIISFISKQLMEVEVAGVRFPVYADDVDHPYLKWFTDPVKRRKSSQPDQDIPMPEKIPPRRLAQGIYLSFLPQFETESAEDIITHFRIHLLNESPDPIRFRYDVRASGGALLFTHQAELHAFGNLYLHPMDLETLNGQPRLQWSLGAAALSGLPFEGVVRIRPSQLVRYIQDMLDANQPAFSILLRSDVDGAQRDVEPFRKIRMTPAGKLGAHQLYTPVDSVLDLHIDPQNAAFSGLDAAGLLDYQLRLFDKKLNAAIPAGLHQMTIIHGVGNGKLRDALHQYLSEISAVTAFRNDWSQQYGWGATQIYF